MTNQAPIVLRPGHGTTVLFSAVSIGSLGMFIWDMERAAEYSFNLLSVVPLMNFLLFGIFVLLQISSSLRLEREQFRYQHLTQKDKVEWSDTTEFTVGKVSMGILPLGRFVMFNEPSKMDAKWAKRNLKRHGATSLLPDNFGMKPVDLAALLNERRVAAIDT